MKVSVIIPAYNEEKNIAHCLQSIFNQVVPADEVIVVNNNSTDNTAKIAREMGAHVIDEPRSGITHARNRGFNEATYEIFARTDADSTVSRDWIQRIKYHLESGSVDALAGPVVFVNSRLIPATTAVSIFIYRFMQVLTGGKQQMLGANMSLTREMWMKIRDVANTSDKVVHEDLDISLKIHEAGGTIGYDKALIVYTAAWDKGKSPQTLLIDYPMRTLRTLIENNKE